MQPGAPPRSVEQQLAMALAQIEALKAEKVIRNGKNFFLDSGASHSVISHLSHVDTNTIPCRRDDKSSGVETANGAIMPISGDGI